MKFKSGVLTANRFHDLSWVSMSKFYPTKHMFISNKVLNRMTYSLNCDKFWLITKFKLCNYVIYLLKLAEVGAWGYRIGWINQLKYEKINWFNISL